MAKPDKMKDKNEDKLSIFKKICDDIAGGEKFRTACENNGKNPMWYYRFLSGNINNREVCELSTHARRQKAHSYFDKCEDILAKLETKEMDYPTAKVLFDSYLRLAGKANQGVYGDKQSVELTGKDGGSISVSQDVDIEKIKELKEVLGG